MYVDDPEFIKPKEKARIWRYMDFTKFVSLIEKKCLYFSRADMIGDPFEGSFSKANIPFRDILYKDEEHVKAEDISEVYKLIREFTVINCWHINWQESAAMWKLYLKSNEGIAIQSNFERLKTSFNYEKDNIYIGKVKYIDYEKELVPEGPLQCFVHKRKSYQHEKELRAIIQRLPSKGISRRARRPFLNGLYVPVDLDILIGRIYVAPTSPEWLFELVKSIIKKYGLEDNIVHQSDLDTEPFF